MSSAAGSYSITADLVNQVRNRFPVGPRLAKAYLEYWCRTRQRTPASLAEILALPAPEPMWFEYALGTNYRGRELRTSLAPFLKPFHSRYLDFGCGFGGCMVAFAKAGMEAHGIEVDPQRAIFANANLADHNLPATALVMNVLAEPGSHRALGRFDVITCIDVIEHVLDVPKTIEIISSLLNPGGIAVFEIPNKNYIPFVNKDGHFSLFGITQLPRAEAISYHKTFFDFDYDVGDYYELGHYFELLRANGCEPQQVETFLHPVGKFEDSERFIHELEAGHAAFQASLKDPSKTALPAPVSAAIEANYQTYQLQLKRELDKAQSPLERELFAVRYLTDFWTIVAKKWS